jgi:hypothetical protein
MRKEEVLLNEPEIVETKSNKVKIAIALIASTLMVAVVTTLLIGHFKFDWFKSDEYRIDANISRNLYQANYFSERKTVNTKFTFETGDFEKKEYSVDSKFVVFLVEKQENLNTAIIVLLSSTATVDGEAYELGHLNMFDENTLKELEANPDGTKYPMAVFKFSEDGKIQEIKLPNNMDEYNAETIVDLIEKVIPKLSRNRKEDMSNGLEIKTKKSKNKRTIVQSETPKQFEEFKGSRCSKVVKTEIEDDKITNIETNSNIHLQSQPEGEDIVYGPKDFTFDERSEISSNEVKYDEKENVELVKKLAEKFVLIDSKALIQSIKDNNKEENEEEKVEEEKEESKSLRNLKFAITASKTFNLASFDVLGKNVKIKYVVSVTGTKAVNKIVITSGLGTFEFGNKGCSGSVSNSHSYKVRIFKFVVPQFPAVSVAGYAKGSLSWGFGFKSGSGQNTKYYAKISGKLSLEAEITAGWKKIASLSAFAEGTVADASGQVTISKGSVSKGSGFSLKMGQLVVGIRGTLAGVFKKELWKKTLYKGWKSV